MNNNLQMIEISEFKTDVGDEIFQISNDYIQKYMSLFIEGKLTTEIRIIKNFDGSYSIYDNKDNIINLIHKKGKKNITYTVYPIGLAAILATEILLTYEITEGSDCIYDQFEYVFGLPYNERIDIFLYYINIIICSVLNFDLEYSTAHLESNDYVLMDCIKNEWIYTEKDKTGKHDVNGEIEYDRVIYSIESWAKKEKIKIRKMYSYDMKDDVFYFTYHEILNKAFEELNEKRDKSI